MKKEKKSIISPFAILSFLLFIVACVIYIATDMSYAFADIVNEGVAQAFRRFMASISGVFDFSLFELLIISIPIILFFIIRRAIKCFSLREGRIRFILNIAAVALILYTGHIFALGIGHNTTPISVRMELDEVEVTEENLAEELINLGEEINSLANAVPRNENGIFDPEYSYKELSEKITDSYGNLVEKNNLPKNFSSRAKGVKNGWAMSYLGITGIYTYYTGEANVNTSYPAYVTVFTAAHEMCHQRGILRENEANFVAYLITSTSDDPSLRYSAAMEMYEYFASALYRTNKDLYYEIHAFLSPLAREDMRAASLVTKKYGDTFIEDISDWINNLYLESSGSGGIVSYSRVVHLVLAYNEKNK